ncbi:hypothetical protein C8Q75DRAFT_812258 [Abortiporus biennis]|nr:hypothetical protein C8Q75DRAFT_812258 [Abortiporus biennis]
MELMKNSFYNALNQAMLQVKHTNLPNSYENPYYQDVRNAERLGRHQQLQQQPPPTIHRAGTSGGNYENPFYADVAHAEWTAAGQLSRFPIVNPSHPGMALSQGHQQTPIHHSGPSSLSQTIQPGNSLGLSLHPVGQPGGSQRHHATPPRGPHS